MGRENEKTDLHPSSSPRTTQRGFLGTNQSRIDDGIEVRAGGNLRRICKFVGATNSNEGSSTGRDGRAVGWNKQGRGDVQGLTCDLSCKIR